MTNTVRPLGNIYLRRHRPHRRNPPHQPYRYKGEYLDPTGLYKMGLRYYDPTQARWTQKDIITTLGNPNSANHYAAFGDDPIHNSDPSGADYHAFVPKDVAAVAGALLSIGASGAASGILPGAVNFLFAVFPLDVISFGVGRAACATRARSAYYVTIYTNHTSGFFGLDTLIPNGFYDFDSF